MQTPWKIKSISMAKLNINVVLPFFYFGQGEGRLKPKSISYPKENILSYLRISHESVVAMCWAFPEPLGYDGFLGLNSFLIQKQPWKLSEEVINRYEVLHPGWWWVLVYFIQPHSKHLNKQRLSSISVLLFTFAENIPQPVLPLIQKSFA